jgi:hypothetical protein
MEGQRVCAGRVRDPDVRASSGIMANRSTPFMLDSYEAEYEEQRKNRNRHAHELDQLRNANRNLSAQL